MPHNLYLHSALVQSRKFQKDHDSIRAAIRFNTIDSTVALILAFFVNAAILVLAAIVFFGKESMAEKSWQPFCHSHCQTCRARYGGSSSDTTRASSS